MGVPKVKELAEVLRSSLNPPFTVNYPFVPSPPPPSFRGKPVFDEDRCVGCGICVDRCPSKAIEIEDLGSKRRLTVHYNRCIYCAFCNYNCQPLEGVKPSQDYKLIFTDKSEAVHSIERLSPVVRVKEDLCIGCARCEYVCKIGAAKLVRKEGKWVSTIDPIKCRGCGICSVACPAMVIEVPLSPLDDVMDKIRGAFPTRDSKPNIMIFHCIWCEVSPDDLVKRFPDSNISFIKIVCSGRLHPVFVLEAFKNGADGVLIFSCGMSDCHFGGGPKNVKPRIESLKPILREVGLEVERLQLVLGSAGEPDRYSRALYEMRERLKRIGPSRLRAVEVTGGDKS